MKRFCSHCGYELIGAERFCSFCGSMVDASSSPADSGTDPYYTELNEDNRFSQYDEEPQDNEILYEYHMENTAPKKRKKALIISLCILSFIAVIAVILAVVFSSENEIKREIRKLSDSYESGNYMALLNADFSTSFSDSSYTDKEQICEYMKDHKDDYKDMKVECLCVNNTNSEEKNILKREIAESENIKNTEMIQDIKYVIVKLTGIVKGDYKILIDGVYAFKIGGKWYFTLDRIWFD